MNQQEIHDYEKTSKDRNAIVVKSNDMIENIRFDLSVTEQKILLFAISQLKRDMVHFPDLQISISDFLKVTGASASGQAYSLVKQSIKNLRDKSWWINDGEKSTLFSWVDYAEIKEHSGEIKIHFSSSLEPYLLEQRENFTQYALIDILNLNSKYSIKFFEICRMNLFRHSFTLSLYQFKKLLNINGDKYKDFYELRRNVLNVAIKEINELTSLNVEVTPIKTGKRITELYFEVNEKNDYAEIGALYERRKKLLK